MLKGLDREIRPSTESVCDDFQVWAPAFKAEAMQGRTMLLTAGLDETGATEGSDLQREREHAETTAPAQAYGRQSRTQRSPVVMHGLAEDDPLILANLDEASLYADMSVTF